MRNAPKTHGPGHWLCWKCFDTVTNHPKWKNRMWITLPNYRSKGGPCASCHRVVKYGERAAKVMLDAPVSIF